MDPVSPLPAPLESWNARLPEATRPRSGREAREVARELEALFISELLKSLEATLPSGSLLGEGGSPIRAGLVRDELARFLAQQGGVGLADMILQSLAQPDSGAEAPARKETPKPAEKE